MRITRTGAVLGGVVSLLAIGGGTAVASNGAAMLLGHSNTATVTTSLTNASGVPLSLTAKPYWPALSVNTKAQINNLNAELLNGMHADAFLPAAGTAADSAKLGGLPASTYRNDVYSAQSRDVFRTATTPIFDTKKFDVLNVPAGTYQLEYSGLVENAGNIAGNYGCYFTFMKGAGPGYDLGTAGYTDIGEHEWGTTTARDLVSFSAPTEVSMRCAAPSPYQGPDGAYVQSSELTAVPLRGLHGPAEAH